MKISEFSPDQIDLILTALAFRKKDIGDNLFEMKHYNDRTKKFYKELGFDFGTLTSLQKAFFAGCVKEYAIDPHREYLMMSDIDILKNYSDYIFKSHTHQIAVSVYNLLEVDKKYHYTPPKDRIDRLKRIISADTVYYSQNGKNIYKAELILDNKNSTSLFLVYSDKKNFFITKKRFRSEFMYKTGLREFRDLLASNIQEDKEDIHDAETLNLLNLIIQLKNSYDFGWMY